MSRKQFTRLLMSGLGFLAALKSGMAQANQQPKAINRPQRPQFIGTTFSQLQCAYIGLDYRQAFRQICDLGFQRLRLCCYWNQIEPQPQQFDFSTLDWLLEECDRRNIQVVLAVGMKVPRWPEFHFPDWLAARYPTGASPDPIDRTPAIADLTLNFIQQVVSHTRQAPALGYWQLENEPFTHLEIAGGRFLSPDFVEREVALLRSLMLPGQKLLLTTALTLPAAQDAADDRAFATSLRLADAVGVNVYTRVPIGHSAFYLEPQPAFWAKLQSWQQALLAADREAWIAEAQAEPWEPNQLVAMQKLDYPSASPLRAENLVTTLGGMGYGTVLLWGCEYWLWQKHQGRNLWWWTVKRLTALSGIDQ